MKRVLMTDHSILSATENRCLNCGNDSPCSCTEPMPAAEVYARHRERQAAAAGQRYEPHCDCNGGHVQMMSDPSGRWLLADDSASSIVQQMPEISDEVLSELRPCPFCGASARVFRDALPLYPIWWVECSRRPIPHHTTAFRSEREALDDWNRRATEADLRAEVERLRANAKGMRALLRAGCDLLSLESEALRNSVNIIGEPDRLSDDPEDAPTIAAITEIEDWIASVKATLFPPALSPETGGGQ
ncbi:Lar family restriction alleviation protein [Paracoccus yeei]|uniref:Lar family restriction alleviation protein n=1 Tax=Paracoccus yeei TaxID=147645 RepID=UPI003BF80872